MHAEHRIPGLTGLRRQRLARRNCGLESEAGGLRLDAAGNAIRRRLRDGRVAFRTACMRHALSCGTACGTGRVIQSVCTLGRTGACPSDLSGPKAAGMLCGNARSGAHQPCLGQNAIRTALFLSCAGCVPAARRYVLTWPADLRSRALTRCTRAHVLGACVSCTV